MNSQVLKGPSQTANRRLELEMRPGTPFQGQPNCASARAENPQGEFVGNTPMPLQMRSAEDIQAALRSTLTAQIHGIRFNITLFACMNTESPQYEDFWFSPISQILPLDSNQAEQEHLVIDYINWAEVFLKIAQSHPLVANGEDPLILYNAYRNTVFEQFRLGMKSGALPQNFPELSFKEELDMSALEITKLNEICANFSNMQPLEDQLDVINRIYNDYCRIHGIEGHLAQILERINASEEERLPEALLDEIAGLLQNAQGIADIPEFRSFGFLAGIPKTAFLSYLNTFGDQLKARKKFERGLFKQLRCANLEQYIAIRQNFTNFIAQSVGTDSTLSLGEYLYFVRRIQKKLKRLATVEEAEFPQVLQRLNQPITEGNTRAQIADLHEMLVEFMWRVGEFGKLPYTEARLELPAILAKFPKDVFMTHIEALPEFFRRERECLEGWLGELYGLDSNPVDILQMYENRPTRDIFPVKESYIECISRNPQDLQEEIARLTGYLQAYHYESIDKDSDLLDMRQQAIDGYLHFHTKLVKLYPNAPKILKSEESLIGQAHIEMERFMELGEIPLDLNEEEQQAFNQQLKEVQNKTQALQYCMDHYPAYIQHRANAQMLARQVHDERQLASKPLIRMIRKMERLSIRAEDAGTHAGELLDVATDLYERFLTAPADKG